MLLSWLAAAADVSDVIHNTRPESPVPGEQPLVLINYEGTR